MGTQMTQLGDSVADMTAEDYFTQNSSQFMKSQDDRPIDDENRVSSECVLPEEEKTTLSETQYMMCAACGSNPMRMK